MVGCFPPGLANNVFARSQLSTHHLSIFVKPIAQFAFYLPASTLGGGLGFNYGASTLRGFNTGASKPTTFTDQYWSRALTLVATFQSLLRKLLNPNLLQKLTGKSLFWAKPNSTKKTYKIDRADTSRRLKAKTVCPPLCDITAKLEAVTKSVAGACRGCCDQCPSRHPPISSNNRKIYCTLCKSLFLFIEHANTPQPPTPTLQPDKNGSGCSNLKRA